MADTDALEFLYYFFGFWLFIFRPDFRAQTLERWRQRRGLEHLMTILDIFIPTVCGLVPLYLIYLALSA